MDPFPIDAFAYANRLRGTHAGEKIVFAAGTVAICVSFGSPAVSLLALGVVAIALSRLAGISVGAFWSFLRLPLGFLLVSLLTIAVVAVPRDAPALAAVTVGPLRFGLTPASAAQASRVLAASLGAAGSTLFLALTTPVADITDQLRRWRVPALFVELMTLIYRFTFVLLETAQAMHIAQDARLGYSTAGRSMRSVSVLISNLYLRANARALALYTALSARGYDGELTVLVDRPAWSARHLAFIAGTQAVLLVVGFLARKAGL